MRALALLPLAALACTTSQRPTMNPGVDCVRCHTQATDVTLPSAVDSPGQRATNLVFSAAGTVFPSPSSGVNEGLANVQILISSMANPDAGLELISNSAGNFYSAEQLLAASGLNIQLSYRGQTVAMAQHPSPALLYGNTTSVVGVGCNGCHSVPALPTPQPDAGPIPSCGLPDGGTQDITNGMPCGGELACCSGLCVGGACSTTAGASGATCTASDDCQTYQCVDGVCSDLPGENGHACTWNPKLPFSTDCRLGYCVAGICAGAPGRISIPSGIVYGDGGFVPGLP